MRSICGPRHELRVAEQGTLLLGGRSWLREKQNPSHSKTAERGLINKETLEQDNKDYKQKFSEVITVSMYEEETAAGLAEEEGHAALLEVLAEGLDLVIRETSGSEPHTECEGEGKGRGEYECEAS
jgi:hypothetical protein